MARVFRFALAFLAVVFSGATASAQFGHPLKGSWSGDVVNGATRTHVLVDLNWDGKNISGTINPGPNGAALTTARLDPATWMVHLEGDGEDASGANVHYVMDGKVEKIGEFPWFVDG